ncbi:hypothetical protein K458DRAFT_406437 [Lentithecium fluviatile CBS 122367]|uniref:Uncharacterized protein n=1 Tax=Lentithecium fluviatile CBS 122367 TaxID=1168545 RepID=A0A6G1IT65_9PLEO|nr:hypothetical protein K458DRAFT_406437 [Lentithecium fluviatile CBS 122367]
MVQQSILALFLLPALALCVPHARHAQKHSAPVVARSSDSLSEYPGQVYLKNSCDYAISIEEFAGAGCDCSEGGTVEAGSSWNETLQACSSGNRVLKVYREGETSPMQFEYGVDGSNVWYDMSFIDCVKDGYDFSACAGEGWAMGSESNCKEFKCSGGEECCTQGYCDPYATGLTEQPVSGCGGDQGYTDSSAMGITIELCAS